MRVNDDKLVLVLAGETSAATRDKVEAARAHIEVARSSGAFPELVLTTTLMPEDAADPDEALMRASTALVLARKAWSS